MGATVDSSAQTSSIRNALLLGGCGLRHTISNMPALLHRPGLQPDCRITEGRFALCALRHRLCFWHLQSGYISSASTDMPYLTRHPERRSGPDCHMFVKGLSARRDKE